jgi:hypothetical protein
MGERIFFGLLRKNCFHRVDERTFFRFTWEKTVFIEWVNAFFSVYLGKTVFIEWMNAFFSVYLGKNCFHRVDERIFFGLLRKKLFS